MQVVRPAGPGDLDSVMELAVLSGPGFTSLPTDETTLAERLALSAASFRGETEPAEAWYTVMLEDCATGQIKGIAGVRAAVGLKRPHFSFRLITLAQFSQTIEKRFDHQALVLVNECNGWTEVGSLFLRPEARAGGAGSLLARARYMLIGAEPSLFAQTIMAELRGWFEPDGSCPFWEGVARKFYQLPFDEADRMMLGTNGQFIIDLAPRHPIYVEILPQTAIDAIGRCHRDGRAALAMLQKEGFEHGGLIDIFDGGPTVTCARNRIDTIANARCLPIVIGEVGEAICLLSTTKITNFRATSSAATQHDDHIVITPETAVTLKVRSGDLVMARSSRKAVPASDRWDSSRSRAES